MVRVNALWHKYISINGFEGESDLADVAISVPMDGFHLYRWQLDAMEVISGFAYESLSFKLGQHGSSCCRDRIFLEIYLTVFK